MLRSFESSQHSTTVIDLLLRSILHLIVMETEIHGIYFAPPGLRECTYRRGLRESQHII